MLEWKPLGAADVQAWSELSNLLAEADGTAEFYSAEDLAEELTEDGVDPALDTLGVWVDGRLVAYGQLRVAAGLFQGRASAWVGGGVAPEYRGRGIGRELMDRLEGRALALAATRHPGQEVLLRASGLREGSSVRPMLEHRGYQVARYFHDMGLNLPATIDLAGLPSVRPYVRELAGATRLAHNEAFAEHWGSTTNTPERWQEFVGSRAFRPELSFLVVAENGEVEAYTMVRCWVPGEAYVDLVGVRPRARHRGLARATLASAVNAASAAGFERVELSVDTQNAQGAGGLYASLGFTVLRTTAAYTKLVSRSAGG